MAKSIDNSVRFQTKEMQEYYEKLKYLSDAEIMQEWIDVTKPLKEYFEKHSVVKKRKVRSSSSAVTFN